MALPSTINPSSPLGTDSPSQGDDQIRDLKLAIVDILGVPNNSAVTAATMAITVAGVVTVSQSPFNVPTLMRGNASSVLFIESRYSNMSFDINAASVMALNATGMQMQTRHLEWASGITGVLGTIGAQPLILRTNTLDRWSVNTSGMLVPVTSNVDLGTVAGPNPRNLYVASNLTIRGQIQAGVAPRIITTTTGMLDARELTLPEEVRGDLMVRGASTWTRLTAGASGRVLKSAGAAADLVYDTIDVSDVGSAVTLTTAQTISGAKTFSVAPIISSTTGIDFTVGGAGTIGTTDAQDFQLKSRGIVRWRLNSSGMLLAQTDNVFDIGASGATRPRDLYVAGDLYSGANRLTSSNELDAAQLTIASEAQGDVLVRSSAGWVRLAAGTSGQYLRTRGSSNDPLWVTDDPGTGITESSNPVTWTGQHTWNAGQDFAFSSPSARVGFGTASPTMMLDIRGNIIGASQIFFGAGSAANPGVVVRGDPDTGFFAPAAGALAISVDGVERARLNTTGFGIATTVPTQLLHVAGRGYVGSHIYVGGLLSAGSQANALTTATGMLDGTLVAFGAEAQGDVLFKGASTWSRLAPGTSGYFLRTLGASANPLWAEVAAVVTPAKATADITAAFTTTSTTLVDVTGATVTMTVAANRVFLMFRGNFGGNAANTDDLAFSVAGTDTAVLHRRTVNSAEGAVMCRLTGVQTAGSRTYKVRAKTSAGTLDLFTGAEGEMAAFEILGG